MTNSTTRDKFPLNSRKIIKKTITEVISICFVIFIIGFIYLLQFYNQETNQILNYHISDIISFSLLFILVITTLSAIYQYWYFITYYYELEENHVTIRKGPITPTEIVVTYDRIQDIYVDQDILDRVLGLYDVHISTATISSGIHAHIDGVLKESAYGLRDIILEEVKKNKNKSL